MYIVVLILMKTSYVVLLLLFKNLSNSLVVCERQR